MIRPTFLTGVLALVGGYATGNDLSLMTGTSGTLRIGEACRPAGSRETQVRNVIDGKGYAVTWVVTAPDYASGYFDAGYEYGSGHGAFGIATSPVIVDPAGGEAKALLRTADGSRLRCDLKEGSGSGGAICQGDRGILYDVQIRLRENK